MTPSTETIVYGIPQIADPADSRYQAIAAGDVRTAIVDGSAHLLRALSHMPPESVSAEFVFTFTPKTSGGDRQLRLNLFLRLRASCKAVLLSLDRLVQGGLLSRFYEFKRIEESRLNTEPLPVTAVIFRREELVRPLYSCDFNARIPDRYYTITAFTPNEGNDYLTLDRVIDRVVEPVAISVKVSPTDVSDLLHAHTAYLALLNAINRSWDDDDGQDLSGLDLLDPDRPAYTSSQSELKPLRNRDPLADDIGRQQRRFHETLRQPHLAFCIQARAKTPAVARLIGSVFGESAFEEGSYRIVITEDQDTSVGESEEIMREYPAGSSLPCEELQRDMDTQDYCDLSRLGRVATVDELLGAFRLPVASFPSPCCIRKSTDPPYESEDNLIVLGCDLEADDDSSHVKNALPRGIVINQLKKHLFVSGTSGQGKTTCIMSILMQLRGILPCEKDPG